ncbi:MAG: hypothetical protein KGJ02_08335, partial [Verrucomicrobiota bacterium]|nr:hypothetical protein [Verrucomicrobiota bacterium]
MRLFFSLFLFFSMPLCSVTTYTVTVATDSLVPNGSFSSGTNTGDLRGCLNAVNKGAPGTYIIAFSSAVSSAITLSGMLPLLNLTQSSNILTVDGSGATGGVVTISGASTYPGFFAYQGTVTLQNLTVENVLSQGGHGSGGGLGAGAGLFIGKNAAVTINNFTINTGVATGGNGGF